MLCMACGNEMLLLKVVEDTTMMVSGYEHHTYLCPKCGEVERRLAFRSDDDLRAAARAVKLTGTPMSLDDTQNKQVKAPSMWSRMKAKLIGGRSLARGASGMAKS
jgi:hypothetical protein